MWQLDWSLMENKTIFIRQIRSRSLEHARAMDLLAKAGLAGQMVSVLRQELDSMVRVIYLLTRKLDRREELIDASVRGERWSHRNSRRRVTDREMVDLANRLRYWTQSVYKFGCAFIHLSNLHDYNDRDPLLLLPEQERDHIITHCRAYHDGPPEGSETFAGLVSYLPKIFEKVSDNLEGYLEQLERDEVLSPEDVW